MTDAQEKFNKETEVARVFTPATPVGESDLFAGRISEIRRAVDAIVQPGQHAIIFGERGVGKTSLAKILSSRLTMPGPRKLLVPMVNCESADTFTTLWKKVFSQIDLITRNPQIGFQYTIFQETVKAADVVGENIDPDAVRRLLTLLSNEAVVLVIFDEFDRLQDQDTKRALADTIKTLSDNSIDATVIFVGVAESVSELIAEHKSISRSLREIEMLRMSSDELGEILDKGMIRLGMKISPDARDRIIRLSRGLPHYTHSLGLHATRVAIGHGKDTVTKVDADAALTSALDEINFSLRDAYDKATFSNRKVTIYAHVLMACALAPTGDFGWFTPAVVRDPLTAIRGKVYRIPAFAKHLTTFSTPERASILQKSGVKRKFRYRFSNPFLQPFIVMKGVATKIISEDVLKQFGA